jgi:hypothetical protein
MLPAPTTIVDVLDLRGDRAQPFGIGAELQRAHEGLAGELQEDPTEDRLRHAAGKPTRRRRSA